MAFVLKTIVKTGEVVTVGWRVKSGLAALNVLSYFAEFDDPHSLVVLAEEELVVVDLESEGWPVFRMPYLVSLHSSAIISTHHVSDVPSELWDKLFEAGKLQCKETYSERVSHLTSLLSYAIFNFLLKNVYVDWVLDDGWWMMDVCYA